MLRWQPEIGTQWRERRAEDSPIQEATMHHPVQYETMAKMRQAEYQREAGQHRLAQEAQANASRPGARRLVFDLALSALAIGLLLAPALLWAR